MLIGIVGAKGSGKDTCADYLVEKHGFVKTSFADPLKKACREIFMFEDSQLWGTQEEKEKIDPMWGVSPRKILQFVGTELFRDHLGEIIPGLGRDFHTRRFELWYKSMCSSGKPKIIVPDIRFQNEADLIRKLGGRVIYLVRDELESSDTHSSEQELKKIIGDYYIYNNHTIQDLYDYLEEVFRAFERTK